MVFNILAVLAFVLSSLCTLFLGMLVYGFYKKSKSVKSIFKW